LAFEDDLYPELVRLRRGRGVLEPRPAERLGPLLRELSGVTPADTDAVARRRAEALLTELAEDLPDDLRIAAELSLALGDRPAGRLTQRTARLAAELGCSGRTARRRMDEAARLMARAAPGVARPGTEPDADQGCGWRVRSFSALLRLDTATPELYETRTVRAERAIGELTVRLDLPPRGPGDGPVLPLMVEAVFGARVTEVDRGDDGRHYRLAVTLPRTLRPAEEAEFCLHYRVPAGQPIRDHCAIVPLDPCDRGDIRVRFDPSAPPATIWRLAAVTPRQMDRATTVPGPDLLAPDGAGEVGVAFRGLRQGHGYGVAWRPAKP
jgi:hypothetical protein